MELIPIRVQAYSGYQADESPRRFLWNDQWIEVDGVEDRWYQADRDPEWPMADYFKVLGDDGRRYLIKHDRESDEWYLTKRW